MPRVGVSVPHLGDVFEADLGAAERAADVSRGEVAALGYGRARRGLGLSVAVDAID